MIDKTLYVGKLERTNIRSKLSPNEKKSRISFRFQQKEHELVMRLAFALDVRPAQATAILLDTSLRNFNFIDNYLQTFINKNLDAGHKKELKK